MMKHIHRLLLLSAFVLILAACGEKVETNMESEVADFEFTDQDGEPVSNDDLEGKWWVADFIFTHCETVCIPMMSNMVNLQHELEEEDVDNVDLVSFCVEPDRDTPEVLKEYAEEYGADLSN